jgi:biotin carboxyl carrier protein
MSRDIYFAIIDGDEYQVEILSESEVVINGTSHIIDFETYKEGTSCSLLVDGKSFEPNAFEESAGWEILIKGRRFSVQVEDERERKLRLAAGDSQIKTGRILIQSPMPGMVIDIPVKEGDEVEKGSVLVILESMKMQNELIAPRAGRVTQIQANVNDNVERKQNLLTLE